MTIISKCNLFIGNDSGAGHIAAAFNVPVITVFTSALPEMVKPWGKNMALNVCISHDYPCKPCFDNNKCKLGTIACKNTIKVEEIVAAVDKIINKLRNTNISLKETRT